MTTPEIKPETVNHPSHYQTAGQGRDGNIECIDVIEAYGIMYSFTLGNAVKYLWRAGSKGDLIADLRKARWYLDRWLEKEGAHPSPDYEIPDEMTPEKVIAALASPATAPISCS